MYLCQSSGAPPSQKIQMKQQNNEQMMNGCIFLTNNALYYLNGFAMSQLTEIFLSLSHLQKNA
jgi:hypothetical protein